MGVSTIGTNPTYTHPNFYCLP